MHSRTTRPATWWRTGLVISLAATIGCAGDIQDDLTGGAQAPGKGGNTGTGGTGASGGNVAPGGPRPAACGPVALGAGLVRRLTTEEIRRSLDVALGVDGTKAIARLPHETRAPKSFRNEAVLLTPGAELISGAEAFAETLAEGAPAIVSRFAPCNTFTDACETTAVEALGLRLFRRPLSPEQVASFRKLFAVAREGGDPFVVGAGLVLRAMVQSPQFLYRIERERPQPGNVRVDDWELASRLSFLVWGAGPDDALFEAARAGRLRTADGFGKELERLLDHPRAGDLVATFAVEWLELDHLDQLELDVKRYPELDAALKSEMLDETRRFFADAFSARRPLKTLITGETTFASDRIAKLYGLTPAGRAPSRYDLAGVPRAGILSQPAFLAAHAGGDTPRIVDRGVTTYRDVLCQEPPNPPPGIDLGLGQKPIGKGVTERTNAEARAANPTCSACHVHFDPLAFPFERFDALGRYADKDPFGNTLRSDGVLLGSDGMRRPYTNVKEFSALLAEDERFASCVVTKGLQLAIGRGLEADPGTADKCLLDDVEARMKAGGGTLRALIAAIATSEGFGLAPVAR